MTRIMTKRKISYFPDFKAIEDMRKKMSTMDIPLLDMGIEYLPVIDKNWNRVINVSKRCSIVTLKDLLVYSKNEVTHFRGLGSKSCEALFQAVEALGLHFREEKSEDQMSKWKNGLIKK